MPAQQQNIHSPSTALLLRLRRLAKRSRAEVACQLCKASKLRCSDYRPCARCKKVGPELCRDVRSSAQSTSRAVSFASASDHIGTLKSNPPNCSTRALNGDVPAPEVQTAMHPPQATVRSDNSSRWGLQLLPPPIRRTLPILRQPPISPLLCPWSSAPLEPVLAETVYPAHAIHAGDLHIEQVRQSIGRGGRSCAET
jgi:hypothetical protein